MIRIGVDVGGTNTDAVVLDGKGCHRRGQATNDGGRAFGREGRRALRSGIPGVAGCRRRGDEWHRPSSSTRWSSVGGWRRLASSACACPRWQLTSNLGPDRAQDPMQALHPALSAGRWRL